MTKRKQFNHLQVLGRQHCLRKCVDGKDGEGEGDHLDGDGDGDSGGDDDGEGEGDGHLDGDGQPQAGLQLDKLLRSEST